MGQAQPAPTRYTVEEYFALEEQSEERHEFFEGWVYPIERENPNHGKLRGNISQNIWHASLEAVMYLRRVGRA